MTIDYGKMKTVEVTEQCLIGDKNIDVVCKVECNHDVPEDSEILSAIACTDDETNVLLSTSDSMDIVN